MCYEPDDYWDFYEESTVKARKRHKCHTCGKSIERGDLYHSFRGRFDGRFDSGKTCGECMAIVYVLHVIELLEGCPDHTSWYPPEDARQQLWQLERDIEYYTEEHPEECGEHGEMLLHIQPMLERPSREIGQKYLGLKERRHQEWSAAYRETRSQSR